MNIKIRVIAASVIVLRDGDKAIFQRVTPPYIVPEWEGRLKLIGGGAENDEDANNTLARELREEIRPVALAEKIITTARRLSTYGSFIPRIEAWDVLAVYYANVPGAADIELLEGALAIEPWAAIPQLVSFDAFAWDHGGVLRDIDEQLSTHGYGQ